MTKANNEETFLAKERRLKARKQTFKMSYKKGLYYTSWKYKNLVDYLNQPDVLVRVLNTGSMDDDTDFITITIEGFKAPDTGI